MLELLNPYLPFISFLTTIVVNILLIVKNAHWWAYIIANVLIIIVFLVMGITPFDFFGSIWDAIKETWNSNKASSELSSGEWPSGFVIYG